MAFSSSTKELFAQALSTFSIPTSYMPQKPGGLTIRGKSVRLLHMLWTRQKWPI
jgi:hypothetical protein